MHKSDFQSQFSILPSNLPIRFTGTFYGYNYLVMTTKLGMQAKHKLKLMKIQNLYIKKESWLKCNTTAHCAFWTF